MVQFHFYNEAKISLIGAWRVYIHGQIYSIFMFVCLNNLHFSLFSRSLVRNALSWADEELCQVMPHQTPAAQQSYQAAAHRTRVLFSYLHRSRAKNTRHLFFSPKCKGGHARSVAISEWELITYYLFIYDSARLWTQIGKQREEGITQCKRTGESLREINVSKTNQGFIAV